MARPTLANGHVPNSDEFSFLLQLVAYKTADESVANSTALQNDDALFLTPATNAVYGVRCVMFTSGGTTGDMRIAFTWPSGASFPWGEVAYLVAAASTAGNDVFLGGFYAANPDTSYFGAVRPASATATSSSSRVC